MSNRLKYEKSPYLLQHAENPVDWYAWGEEAFQKAKKENKPIFLSIGYSTCHWCHVMAHESFESQEIAKILNQDFVSVKVDREERPDIDSVYMAVCQAMNGNGGWPLTIIMTPEQKPFFAATYLPKKGRYGQAGLSELLLQVAVLWNTQKELLLESAEKITSAIASNSNSTDQFFHITSDDTVQKTYQKLIENAYLTLKNNFDTEYGGFGRAPKFPSPHNLSFLMRYATQQQKTIALQMALETLRSMANGGIFDQIGGGFSRYSTDEKWLVPHFEKMLYDNALLIIAYLHAYLLTQDQQYADTAKRTADYLLRELMDETGGFYCGQDADSNGSEGSYYVFTPQEITRVLGDKDGTEFCRLYHISEEGNFEGNSIPNRIADNPSGAQNSENPSISASGSPNSAKNHAWSASDERLQILLDYRKKRMELHTDTKLLTSWNAWTIIALAQAGLIFQDGSYMNAALKAQEFIEQKLAFTSEKDSKRRLFLRYIDGEAAFDGQLDDYAVYALALITLYRITFNTHYLKLAIEYAKQIILLFADEKNGGFFLNASDSEQLIMRPKETYDGAVPSGNSVASSVFEELAGLTGDIFWRQQADRQYAFLAEQAEAFPAGHCFTMFSLLQALSANRELVCAGNSIPSELTPYLRINFAGNLSTLFKSKENAELLAECAPFTKEYPVPENGTLWYLCENGSCNAPTNDFNRLNL